MKRKNGNEIKVEDDDQQKKKKENKVSSLWAQLSDDLLGEILSRLSLLSDQVCFHAVCKNWLKAVNYNNITLLPWVIHIRTLPRNNNIQCHLYEPSSSNIPKPTRVYKMNLPRFHNFLNYNELHITTHKYGWIFGPIVCGYYTNFLLFSPLTKKEISLPSLDHSRWKNYKPITQMFSTKPDSPDCVFLVLCLHVSKDIITINIFRHGYKEWKTQEFRNEGVYIERGRSMPVYIEGIFYFFTAIGELASYNVARGEWKVECVFVENVSVEGIFFNDIYMSIFELNGELVVIGISEHSGYIRMFDRSTKAWVPLKSLGNQSIFVSYSSILVSTIEKEGKNNYGVLPNKIYCSIYWMRDVYSLENGKLAGSWDESDITEWAKASAPSGYWFDPPVDLIKRNEPRNSVRKLVTETSPALMTNPATVEELVI